MTLHNLVPVSMVTAHDLTLLDKIAAGLVQGEGMDPLLYVLYTVMLFIAMHGTRLGVHVHLAEATVRVMLISAVDDTVVIEPSVEELQATALEFVRHMQVMNTKMSPSKCG